MTSPTTAYLSRRFSLWVSRLKQIASIRPPGRCGIWRPSVEALCGSEPTLPYSTLRRWAIQACRKAQPAGSASASCWEATSVEGGWALALPGDEQFRDPPCDAAGSDLVVKNPIVGGSVKDNCWSVVGDAPCDAGSVW